MRFRKILVPLDGSPLAERALVPAMAFAEAMNAAIFLVRVVVPLSLNLDPRFYQLTIKTGQEKAKHYLQHVQSRFSSSPIDLRTRVVVGPAAASILKCLKEEHVDLLVMSSRDCPGASRLIRGSVATKILADISCASIIVHPQVEAESFSVQRILAPLYEPALVEQALAQALQLAECMSADLIILAAHPSLRIAAQSVLNRQGINGVKDTAAWQPLQESTPTIIQERPISVSVHSPAALDAQEIIDCADRQHVDVITMCCYRRSGIGRWLFRSMIEKVTQGAKCVTLIVQVEKTPP